MIPKRHVESLFKLQADEQSAVWNFVAQVRDALKLKFNPDAFNIGLNDGVVSGQTILHAHIHIIPRRKGDVTDPRGGVRWLIPEKAKYWTP